MAFLQHGALVQYVFGANIHSSLYFQMFVYACLCLNGSLIAAVLHSPFPSTGHAEVPSKSCFAPRFKCLTFPCHYSACDSGGIAFPAFLQVPPGHSLRVRRGAGAAWPGRAGPAPMCGAGGRWQPSSPEGPAPLPAPAPLCSPRSTASRRGGAAFPRPLPLAISLPEKG